MKNPLITGTYKILPDSEKIHPKAVEPFRQMDIGSIFTIELQLKNLNLGSGKGYSVDAKVIFNGKTYVMQGGRLASAIYGLSLEKL